MGATAKNVDKEKKGVIAKKVSDRLLFVFIQKRRCFQIAPFLNIFMFNLSSS